MTIYHCPLTLFLSPGLVALPYNLFLLIIPKENQKDLEEIPPHVLSQFKIVCVEQIEQVLENALTRMPERRT